jgi:hypothetical protein
MATPILACIPVDPDPAKRRGVPWDGPRPGFTVTDCEVCGEKVWIGPRQAQERTAHGWPALCAACAVLAGGGTVQDLGG